MTPLQILDLSSVSWKITPLYFFNSNNIYFTQKDHIKMKIFETFKCSGQNSSNPYVNFDWQVNSSSNFASFFIVVTYNFSVDLSSHFSYFGLKDPINMPILRLSIALVKICHIPHVIFQSFSFFFFQISHHSSVSWKITPL